MRLKKIHKAILLALDSGPKTGYELGKLTGYRLGSIYRAADKLGQNGFCYKSFFQDQYGTRQQYRKLEPKTNTIDMRKHEEMGRAKI